MPLQSINPTTGEIIAEYAAHSSEEISAILQSSAEAQSQWARVDIGDRCAVILRLADGLREGVEEFAKLMTLEMGKPIAQARSEVEKCAATAEFFAANATRFLAPEPVATEAKESFVTFKPLGVVLAVMPWNFPFWQLCRCAIPALVAGNAVVLKHASNVSGCALALERVFHQASFRHSLFRTVLAPSAAVGDIIRHPAIAAVSLTGSTGAGRSVATAAGAALKKTVLELGGSDAYLVLADADLDLAVRTCVSARLVNCGQSCVAAKRFIVAENVAEEFTRRFVAAMVSAVVGDPMNPQTTVGPMARPDLRDELHTQVQRSVAGGARLLLGGKIPEGKGAFYSPTVLSEVTDGMAVWDEETFGPVAAIRIARTEAEAIALANRSSFGLGAVVFSRDMIRARAIAQHELQAGNCFVNASVKSDPRLPFGGIKDSGYGRELAAFGLREFVNVKTVWVE